MGATQSHERLASTAPAAGRSPVIGLEPPDRSGALIANRYRVAERIHAGSAGILYRADDLAFSRPVALRVLTAALSRDESVLARLQARLDASAAMARDDVGASGDIVDLIDLGHTDDALVFVVTEFLPGESLAAVLEREGPFGWPVLRPLMVRACQILHLSHQHGLLRLDLQTRHLFPVRDKTATSTLKILSPGIGDVFGDSLWTSLDPGAAAGHLRYAAPEQLTGATVDARTDVYALGVIMFELLSGRVPFPDTQPAYVCARHLLEAPPPFPAGIRAKLPEAVVAIVARALAKQPDDRWPTMRALANAMAAIDFGPCDASGVLEVVDVEVPAPAASATTMRIDPAAGHAPSPSVLPRTMPPVASALMADTEPGVGGRPEARPPDTTFATTVRWFSLPDSGTASASNSASSLAWDEILAAAEEAIAAVAASASTGTAGDSDVFMPERLLHTGEAATASTLEGRLAPEDGGVAPEIAAALPLSGEVTFTTDSAMDELAADSIASLRAPVDRSASVWPVVPAPPAALPRRSFVWAAAAVLAFGATAGALHLLGPRGPAPAVVTTDHAAAYSGPIDRGVLPASIQLDLPEETDLDGADGRGLAPIDLPSGPVAGLPAPAGGPGQWASDPPRGPPGAATMGPSPAAVPRIASAIDPSGGGTRRRGGPSPGRAAGATNGPAAAGAPAQPPSRATQPAGEMEAAPSARDPEPAALARETEPAPSPRREAEPGTPPPEAAREAPQRPADGDPLHAATLLERAGQASARGDRAAALRLAIDSYLASPNVNALVLAGDLACRLGDGGKARWAHRHLPPAQRPALEAACKAAQVAYE